MQAAVADMVGRGAPGTIVNIITSSAHGGQSFLAPYVAAKAGLVGLTRNVAHAHRWDRIRVNGLNIGWTATEGEDATILARERVVFNARVDHRTHAAPGERLRLAVDPARFHFFDPQTGAALPAGAAAVA